MLYMIFGVLFITIALEAAIALPIYMTTKSSQVTGWVAGVIGVTAPYYLIWRRFDQVKKACAMDCKTNAAIEFQDSRKAKP